jgi:hypothetical protein
MKCTKTRRVRPPHSSEITVAIVDKKLKPKRQKLTQSESVVSECIIRHSTMDCAGVCEDVLSIGVVS